ncbi:hypothetical protein ACWDUI_35465 [Streptosporangium sandarakinum]
MAYDGHLTTLPMGRYLDRALGGDYVAPALTSTADHTVEMYPDPDAALGFTIAGTALAPPEPGSVEAAALDAGIGLALVDLRRARHSEDPARPGIAVDQAVGTAARTKSVTEAGVIRGYLALSRTSNLAFPVTMHHWYWRAT